MTRLTEDLFFGIYFHLLKVEGGGKKEISSYFAYSTVYVLIILESLIVTSILLLSEINIFFVNNRIIDGVIISALLFLVNWFLFLKDKNYKKFLPLYFKKNERAKLAEKRTLIITSLIFIQLFLVIGIKAAQLS